MGPLPCDSLGGSVVMTFTVIRVAGKLTRPLRTIEADSREDAWAIALSVYGDEDITIVYNEED